MNIRRNRNFLIISLIICYVTCFLIMPTTPNRVYLRMLVIGFVIIGYYRLHLSMYFNYAKTFIMCALVLFGTLFTAGVIGLIINIYCIYQSNKMLKNQKI